MLNTHALRLIVFTLFALAPSLWAQIEDREQTVPTGTTWLTSVDIPTISAEIAKGKRITDIEVVSTSPLRYDVAMVDNSGVYRKVWWWQVNSTGAGLSSFISANNARIIDLEVNLVNGSPRFTAVMIRNTGTDAKAWWWHYNTSVSKLSAHVSANTARIVDLEQYTSGRTIYYAAVSIRNTGADQRYWTWWVNVDQATVMSKLSSLNSRIWEMQRTSSGSTRFNCIMVRNTGSSAIRWWYYLGLTKQQAEFYVGQNGARIIDTERSGSRYDVVMVNNSNALTSRVGKLMRAQSNGARGVFLKKTWGGELAALLPDYVHEPASTLKLVHHVHAMRQVFSGNISLTTSIPVYTGMSGSCPTGTGMITEPLETVLTKMMRQSDNARTHAITTKYGMNALTSTAFHVWMKQTYVKHHIGCGTPANETTVRDISTLYERVLKDGYLGPYKAKFFSIMRGDFTSGFAGGKLNTVLAQEATAAGLSAAQFSAFKSHMQFAYKGGSYTVSSRYYRSWGAWVTLPFYHNGGYASTSYTLGSFVDGATNEAGAISAAASGASEVLREEIRAAMATLKGRTFGSLQPYGVSCNGSNGKPIHSGNGVPDIGKTTNLTLSSARLNSNAILYIGLSKTVWGTTPLPLSLGFIGATGCYQYTAPILSVSRAVGLTGSTSYSIAIPNNKSLIGGVLYSQYHVLDAGANAAGFVSTNGLKVTVGGQL